MKKIKTLFKKDPNDLGRVINEIDPENEWALTEGWATRKWDGTACAIIDGELYKRFDLKPGRTLPPNVNAIPCQDADPITKHHPHWVKCDRDNPNDKYHFEAFSNRLGDGTYELCGPKINGNREKISHHVLIRHGAFLLDDLIDYSFDGIRKYLMTNDVEGIVFYDKLDSPERMCKIRKKDFKP